MLIKLFGSIFIVSILYILFIFVAPDSADTYWNKGFNTKIRKKKNQSLQFASGSDTPTSLFDKIKGSSTTLIKDTKDNIKWLETSVDVKVKQVHEASIAVGNAYSGVMDATQKIQNITGTGK